MAVDDAPSAGTKRLGEPSGALVVIGNFDGVHRGHQAVLLAAAEEAHAASLVPTVLTFHPHPAVVLTGRVRPVLTTPERKRVLLQGVAEGLEVVTETFDARLSAMSPEEFVDEVLVRRLRAAIVIVGENFRFGRGRRGDLTELERLGRKLGFEARAETLRGDEQGAFSSTRVRESLERGDVAEAGRILGRPHRFAGIVTRGDGRGRTLGFPTANLEGVPQQLPAAGVYSGFARISVGVDDEAPPLQAVVNVGPRPTVNRPDAVEVHLLDDSLDLYGRHLCVDLVAHLRAVRRFSSLDELKEQIGRDVEAARQSLRR